MGNKVLITGGTGSLGNCLSKILHDSGYEVRHLSRTPRQGDRIKSYKWDYKRGEIDLEAFKDLDYLIHLAGAPVVQEKWTRSRKVEIRDSRIKSAELLYETIVRNDVQLKAYVSASALGYYGYDSGGVLKNEESRFGDDFLATVVKEWEDSSSRFNKINIRQISLRIGLILSNTGGALPSIAKPIRMGVGAPIGSGEQYMSWIHEYDMAQIIKFALQ